ncbi:mechanosensitive ion channel family protein [Mucilaginibacter lacusdianchii]|uniref:mechanosensitive ion channel family protein n=1 Tax=Mucilaginibacter lacusdianchii TaxID=2684211 RepID=UPI00131BC23F|nr:mechanosensitive ion channel domain-containing protein [Mucilaginibacter sp. JXJ CY 39]
MKTVAPLPPGILEFSNQISPYLWNVIVAATAVVIGLIIKYIITRLLKHYTKKEEAYSLFRSIIIHVGTPLTSFIQLFLFGIALPYMRMNKEFRHPIAHILGILLTIAFATLLINGIRVLEDYVYNHYDLNKTDNLKERKIRTQLQFLRKLIVATIVFITICLILLSFESLRKIGTGLLTSVGIGGIIVGFAAQNSLGNLLAGFQIAFTQPMRIDDVLVVENEWGRVEDITLTYVVMRLWDQRRLILPISYFIQKPFQNWTRISADIVGAVYLYMDYSIPLTSLRTEFERLMAASPIWDGKVKALQMTDAKDNVVEIRLLISARNSSDAFDLRCYIRENMVTYIQQNYPDSLPKVRATFNTAANPAQAIPNINF